MQRLALSFALVISAAACASSGDAELDPDDHGTEWKALEGPELTDFLAAGAPVEVTSGFRRLGLLWDATDAAAIEARTSLDGVTWTAWAAPNVVTSEEVAHGGHVDAIAASDAGSTEDDPRARWYQLRAAAGVAPPTFLVIEPLPDIPAVIDPAETTEAADNAADTETDGAPYSVVLGTPIGGVRVYTRADWGARAPRCASGSQIPNRATIHHTVTPTNDSMSPQARLRQIQSFHMFTNGWCDIGYNHLISRDGRVWRGRGAKVIGAHVSNNNTGNEGISFMGTYTSTAPTSTQMCSAAKLLRYMNEHFSVALNRTDVKGHRQYGGTACPGTALYNRIDAIIRKAKNGCSAN